MYYRCDADSSALARYVLALLKKDKPEKDLKRIMIEQLDVFLAEETTPFVEHLFEAINTEEYLKGATAATMASIAMAKADTIYPNAAATSSNAVSVATTASITTTTTTTATTVVTTKLPANNDEVIILDASPVKASGSFISKSNDLAIPNNDAVRVNSSNCPGPIATAAASAFVSVANSNESRNSTKSTTGNCEEVCVVGNPPLL